MRVPLTTIQGTDAFANPMEGLFAMLRVLTIYSEGCSAADFAWFVTTSQFNTQSSTLFQSWWHVFSLGIMPRQTPWTRKQR